MSAVEYLIDWMGKNQYFIGNDLLEAVDQAKELERAEHSKTWDAALDKYEVRAGNYMRAYEDFDDYYNKNFKL